MNQDSLECYCNDFHDTIEDVDTARDGGVNVEHSNSDSEATVDVNEEDTKVEKKHVYANTIFQRCILIFVCQFLNLDKSHHCSKNSQKVYKSMQNFAQVFKNWFSFKVICAEEHNQVKEDQEENHTSK